MTFRVSTARKILDTLHRRKEDFDGGMKTRVKLSRFSGMLREEYDSTFQPSTEKVFRTLLQMRVLGLVDFLWDEHLDAIIIRGTIAPPSTEIKHRFALYHPNNWRKVMRAIRVRTQLLESERVRGEAKDMT